MKFSFLKFSADSMSTLATPIIFMICQVQLNLATTYCSVSRVKFVIARLYVVARYVVSVHKILVSGGKYVSIYISISIFAYMLPSGNLGRREHLVDKEMD